ncbi:MAG TPA: hypothetical protein VGB05_09485 [Pyrinomonadaceae bacterium]|jgi:hypothetical protein
MKPKPNTAQNSPKRAVRRPAEKLEADHTPFIVNLTRQPDFAVTA